jgi:pilus assembly protein CpaB
MAAKRYTIVFYVALLVAVIATFGVYRVLEATKASSKIATIPVVVAAKDMPEGVIVDRMALVVAQWPAGTQPAGAYTSVDSVAGRVTRVPVYKGEAMVPGRLAPEGTGAGLEVKITPGKRAYGIRINDVASLAGMVQPNSRVDIMVVMNDPKESRQVAKLFMSNMRVLAIGAAPERAQDGRPINAAVASIEVTPEQSETLAIAAAQGALQLVLRGYGDPDSIETKGANPADVLADLKRSRSVPVPVTQPRRQTAAAKPAAAAPVQPAPPPVVLAPPPKKPDTLTVQVFRGNARSDNKFQADSAKRDSTARKQP